MMTRHVDDLRGRWLRTFATLGPPRVRWVCLPHGGAGAGSFRPWVEVLRSIDPGVELVAAQYPGREDRFDDPPARDIGALTAPLAVAIEAWGTDTPVVVLGHSLGGLVGYELVRRLEGRGRSRPVLLVVSGHEAPHRLRTGTVHRRSDAGLREEIRRIGGQDPGEWGDPALRRWMLEVLREDYRLVETHTVGAPTRLRAPVLALGGADDPDLGEDELRAWSDVTTDFRGTHLFPGRHLIPAGSVPGVIRAVSEAQRSLTPIDATP